MSEYKQVLMDLEKDFLAMLSTSPMDVSSLPLFILRARTVPDKQLNIVMTQVYNIILKHKKLDIPVLKKRIKTVISQATKRLKPKKKSALQKKIDDPNSKLWRNKADKFWKQICAIQGEHKCSICGSLDYVQAHHLIPREMYTHRHVPKNGILLCASHHKYSFELSPHKAPIEFFKWMQTNKAELLTWALEQKPARKSNKTMKEVAEELEIIFNSLNKETPDTKSGVSADSASNKT